MFTGLLAMIAMMAQQSHSDEWVVALGRNDIFDQVRDESNALTIEYHPDPFVSVRSTDVSWMVAMQADGAEDVFLGGGIYAFSCLGDGPVFVEASTAIGPFHQGPDPVKPADDALFRTSLGIGMELSERARGSLSIDHLNNLHLRNRNPGSEAVMLRYTSKF